MSMNSIFRCSRMITFVVALVGIWVGSVPCAATQKTAHKNGALRIARVRFDPQTSMVDVDLANHTKTSVTAYGMTVITTFSDGTTAQQHLTNDISQSLILTKVFPRKAGFKFDKDPESLRPGEHTHFRIAAGQSETGSSISSIKAVLTAAMFADGTSRGDKREAARVHASWSRELEETRRWLPELTNMRSSKDVRADSSRLSTKLDREETDQQSEPDIKSVVRRTIKMHMDQIERLSVFESSGRRTIIPKLIEVTQARAILLAHQLRMARKGGAQ